MENEALVKLIQKREQVRENMATLYQQNHGLIFGICRKYCPMWREPGGRLSPDMEDLLQQAYIGMDRAVKSYDPSAGTSFSTWAVPIIKQEISRYRAACGTPIKVSEHERALYYQYDRLTRYMIQNMGRKPTESEYSRFIGVSIEKVRKMEKRVHDAYTVLSLDTPLEGDDGSQTTLGDFVADARNDMEAAEDRMFWGQVGAAMDACMERMEEKQADVIRLRQEGFSRKEIAEFMGINVSAVDTLEKKGYTVLSRDRRVKQFAYDSGVLLDHERREWLEEEKWKRIMCVDMEPMRELFVVG